MVWDRITSLRMPAVAESGRSLIRGLAVLLAALVLLVSGAPAKAAYWNVFNIEGENSLSAVIVTYTTLTDMLNDTNRIGTFEPDGGGAEANVIGSGSDGSAYWNVFNIEGENSLSAVIVTYATLVDMLTDVNRIGTFEPDGGGAEANVIGSGADILSQIEIPEPGMLSLIGSGLLALAVQGRRRRAPKQR